MRAASVRRGVWIRKIIGCAASIVLLSLTACDNGELHYSVVSPDQGWRAESFRRNPGAAGSLSEYVMVTNVETAERRLVWEGPQLPESPEWVSEGRLSVGEQSLNVKSDSYNFWEARSSDGFPDPERAARAYVQGVLQADLRQVQRASDAIVTRGMLDELRLQLIGQEPTAAAEPVIVSRESLDDGMLLTFDFGSTPIKRRELLVVSDSGRWYVAWVY